MYTDRDGNELDTRDILSGTNKLGLPYTTAPKTIGSLVLVNSPANATGVFTIAPQVVNYVYKRDDAGDVTIYHKSVHDGSDLVAPTVLAVSKAWTCLYKQCGKYRKLRYRYIACKCNRGIHSWSTDCDLLVQKKRCRRCECKEYLDVHGNSIESDDTISGANKLGLNYTTSPKAIPYYDLVINPANATGVFTTSPIKC